MVQMIGIQNTFGNKNKGNKRPGRPKSDQKINFLTCKPYRVLAHTSGDRSSPESTIAVRRESMTESSTHTSVEELSKRCRLKRQLPRDVEST